MNDGPTMGPMIDLTMDPMIDLTMDPMTDRMTDLTTKGTTMNEMPTTNDPFATSEQTPSRPFQATPAQGSAASGFSAQNQAAPAKSPDAAGSLDQTTPATGSSSPAYYPKTVAAPQVKPLHAWIVIIFLALILAVNTASLVMNMLPTTISRGGMEFIPNQSFPSDQGMVPQNTQSSQRITTQ